MLLQTKQAKTTSYVLLRLNKMQVTIHLALIRPLAGFDFAAAQLIVRLLVLTFFGKLHV